MNQTIAMNPQVAGRFKTFMESGRILLFSAPCSFGKTAVAKELLKGHKVCAISADETDFTHFSPDEGRDVILIDQLQLLQNQEEQQALSALIDANPQKRFVFLTRGTVPGWLIPFQFSGMMITVHTDLLFLGRDETAKLLKNFQLHLSESEFSAFLRDSQGYPLAAVISIALTALSNLIFHIFVN